MRKTFTPSQKATVALAAIKGNQTISQIASNYSVHPTQVKQWKEQVLSGISTLFTDKRRKENKEGEELVSELYKLVGQRELEVEWLKKKLSPSSP